MNTFRIILSTGLFFFLLMSCNNVSNKKSAKVNSMPKSTPAQRTMKNCIRDLKNDSVPIKIILNKYFYNYEEISNSEPYDILYRRYYTGLRDIFINDSYDMHYYWNNEIDTVPLYHWVNDNTLCNENLLILLSDKENDSSVNYITYCFTEKGKIYSNVTIVNPNDTTTVWVRAEDKYVREDSTGFDIVYPASE